MDLDLFLVAEDDAAIQSFIRIVNGAQGRS
jgi:hypothetical protein